VPAQGRVCGLEAVWATRWTTSTSAGGSFVLVVGRDVADRFVQSQRVVLDPDPGELRFEHDRVVDVLKVATRP
jgi:hypothetical protein